MAAYPPGAPPTPTSLLKHWIARFVLWLIGWQTVGSVPPYKKIVVLAAHHTTNLDGFLLVMAAWYWRTRLDWMVKAELTHGPFGWLVKALGGVPIDRSASFDMVEQMVQQFAQRDEMVLAISPEGTRKKRDHWKSGFYWIAHRAQVPILIGKVDYAKKLIDIDTPLLWTTGDIHADVEKIWAEYRDVNARYPDRVSDMRLRGVRQAQAEPTTNE